LSHVVGEIGDVLFLVIKNDTSEIRFPPAAEYYFRTRNDYQLGWGAASSHKIERNMFPHHGIPRAQPHKRRLTDADE
jgi:hypothetical protein